MEVAQHVTHELENSTERFTFVVLSLRTSLVMLARAHSFLRLHARVNKFLPYIATPASLTRLFLLFPNACCHEQLSSR